MVIATYNRKELVCEAIDSVLAQTFPNFELIVSDDGSTDGTADLLRSRYGDLVRVVSQENRGAESAYQFGVSFASGEYLAFLDSDDNFLPHTLSTYETIIRELDSPPVILGSMRCCRDLSEIDREAEPDGPIGLVKYRNYYSKDMAVGLAQSRFVIRKALFDEAYSPFLAKPSRFMVQDYHLALLIGPIGPCVITLSPVTVCYRKHEGQASNALEFMTEGVIELIDSVRGGAHSRQPGLRFPKYAYLGGPVREWMLRAWEAGNYRLAWKLAARGWPMMGAAGVKRLGNLIRGTGTRIDIPCERLARVREPMEA